MPNFACCDGTFFNPSRDATAVNVETARTPTRLVPGEGDKMTYETPSIVDHGSLVQLTAMINVGGPVDTHGSSPPGHSCPTGPPNATPPGQEKHADLYSVYGNDNQGPGNNNGSPPCVGNGGGVGNGNDFPGTPDFNPANPGQGGGTPPSGP
jgi:hypothetical protein